MSTQKPDVFPDDRQVVQSFLGEKWHPTTMRPALRGSAVRLVALLAAVVSSAMLVTLIRGAGSGRVDVAGTHATDTSVPGTKLEMPELMVPGAGRPPTGGVASATSHGASTQAAPTSAPRTGQVIAAGPVPIPAGPAAFPVGTGASVPLSRTTTSVGTVASRTSPRPTTARPARSRLPSTAPASVRPATGSSSTAWSGNLTPSNLPAAGLGTTVVVSSPLVQQNIVAVASDFEPDDGLLRGVGGADRMTLEYQGSNAWAIRSSNGRYWAPELGYAGDGYAEMRARSTSVGRDELFQLYRYADGRVSIRSLAAGAFLQVMLPDGTKYQGTWHHLVRATASAVDTGARSPSLFRLAS